MKKRLDVWLVEKGMAPSRTKAQDLIKSKSVWISREGKWVLMHSPSQPVDVSALVEVKSSELQKYVSRGGLKLEGALDQLALSVQDQEVIDVGLSTGGFTDCLLQRGARHVVGVDVGHGQLHPSLQKDSRITSLEGVNARELNTHPDVMKLRPANGWQLAVIDVSFISLELILPALIPLLAPQGQILALVKPQFEVGPENLGKGGIVKDAALYADVEIKIRQKCLELNLTVRDYLESKIEGKDGNQEFFIFAQKN